MMTQVHTLLGNLAPTLEMILALALALALALMFTYHHVQVWQRQRQRAFPPHPTDRETVCAGRRRPSVPRISGLSGTRGWDRGMRPLGRFFSSVGLHTSASTCSADTDTRCTARAPIRPCAHSNAMHLARIAGGLVRFPCSFDSSAVLRLHF